MGYLNTIYCVHKLYDRLEAITAFVTCFLVSVNINWTDKIVNASISISIALVSALLVQIMKLLKIPEFIVKKLKKKDEENI